MHPTNKHTDEHNLIRTHILNPEKKRKKTKFKISNKHRDGTKPPPNFIYLGTKRKRKT